MPRLAAATLLACSLLLLPCATTCAQSSGNAMRILPQAELDVVKVLTMQERAWNEGDMNSLLAGYKKAPDTIFVGENVQHGSDTLAQRYHATYPNRDAMGTLSFSDLETRLLDDHYAIATGHYHLERPRKAGGEAHGVFSLVFEKTPEGWKIILDHTS